MGAGTLYFLTVQSAISASTGQTYLQALSNMENRANMVASSGLGQFAKLQPIGGSGGSGTDLYVVETPLGGGSMQRYGPNNGVSNAVDESNNIYEYEVVSSYSVGPFMNLSMLPFVGNVPGVGSPVQLSMTTHRIVEHPNGLAGGSGGSGGGVITGTGSGLPFIPPAGSTAN